MISAVWVAGCARAPSLPADVGSVASTRKDGDDTAEGFSLRYTDGYSGAELVDGGSVTLFTMDPASWGYSADVSVYPMNWSGTITGHGFLRLGDETLGSSPILLYASGSSPYTSCYFNLPAESLPAPPDGTVLTLFVQATVTDEEGAVTSREDTLDLAAVVDDPMKAQRDTGP